MTRQVKMDKVARVGGGIGYQGGPKMSKAAEG